jgi:hypothetical protein
MEHGGHQGPLLLGQTLGRTKEKIGANGRQTVATRALRRRERWVRSSGSDGPFFRHHQAVLADFG